MRYTKEINKLKIKQTNRKKELIIILATLAIMYIIVSLFKVYESSEFQYSVVRFIRIINGLIATISIAVGLNLYKKTKELSIYILLLVYISFAITVIFGQIDYATFLNYSFNVTNYLTITVSLLRVVILSSIIIPNSTIYKIIEKNRGKSLIFVITYSIFAWIIEKQLFVGGIFENKKTLIIYTIFLNISYLVIAIKLLLKSINKNRVILNAFSISLLIVAIKLLYITMVFKYNSFNMKLISALLTYLTFFVVVVGSVIELYLINGKVEHLNNELGGKGIASWIEPNGGYFISLDVMPGCAKRIGELCKDAGVVLTTIGATYPYGIDPQDTNIRIAPSYPSVDELSKAAELLCICVQLACLEKLLK